MSRLFDALPLYATDSELSVAVLGKRSREWTQFVLLYEGRGLPKINHLLGGRYVPAVRKFLDVLEGVEGHIARPIGGADKSDMSAAWNKTRRSKAPA